MKQIKNLVFVQTWSPMHVNMLRYMQVLGFSLSELSGCDPLLKYFALLKVANPTGQSLLP